MRQRIKENSAKLFHSKEASLAWEKVFKDVYDKFLDDQDQSTRPTNLKIPDLKNEFVESCEEVVCKSKCTSGKSTAGTELMYERMKNLFELSPTFNVVMNNSTSETASCHEELIEQGDNTYVTECLMAQPPSTSRSTIGTCPT